MAKAFQQDVHGFPLGLRHSWEDPMAKLPLHPSKGSEVWTLGLYAVCRAYMKQGLYYSYW